MIVTASEFLTQFPMFASKSTVEIERTLQEAERDCPADRWKADQVTGIMLKTAHLLAMDWYETSQIVSAAIPLTGGQPGRTASPGSDDLDVTTWGRRYKKLARSVVGAPGTYFSGL